MKGGYSMRLMSGTKTDEIVSDKTMNNTVSIGRWITGTPVRAIAAIIAVLLSAGCVSGPQYSDKSAIDSTIFRDEWFDYYNRALRRIQEQDYEGAEKDLREAVAFRTKDSHGARTYGVHFQSYYPHRELGILSLHQGDYRTAERELEQSLHDAPTSKTKYYLSEARKLRVSQEQLDLMDPAITLSGISGDYHTNQRILHISGTASDDTYVRRISINGEAQLIELAEPTVEFEKDVSLTTGNNRMSVIVEDINGRITTSEIPITVDVEAPSLSLDEVRVAEQAGRHRVWLRGGAVDRSGIIACRIHNESIPVQNNTVDFNQWFDVMETSDKISFVLQDQAGNQNSGVISLRDEQGRWRIGNSETRSRSRVAGLGPISGPILFAAEDTPTKPVIKLDLESGRKVFTPELYITGRAEDNVKIESIRVEGEEISTLEIRPSKSVYFGYLAKFSEAKTYQFKFTSVNNAGQAATEVLSIIYEPVMSIDDALWIAPMPFTMIGDIPKAASESAFDSFISSLEDRHRFKVLERKYLPEIYREYEIHKLGKSRSGEKDMLPVINWQGANLFLTGRMRSEGEGIQINVDINNVKSGMITRQADIYCGHHDIDHLKESLNWLTMKIVDEVPICAGKITEVRAKTRKVKTSLTTRERVIPFTRLKVFENLNQNAENGVFKSIRNLLSRLFAGSQAQASEPPRNEDPGPAKGTVELTDDILESRSYANIKMDDDPRKYEVGDIVISQ